MISGHCPKCNFHVGFEYCPECIAVSKWKRYKDETPPDQRLIVIDENMDWWVVMSVEDGDFTDTFNEYHWDSQGNPLTDTPVPLIWWTVLDSPITAKKEAQEFESVLGEIP